MDATFFDELSDHRRNHATSSSIFRRQVNTTVRVPLRIHFEDGEAQRHFTTAVAVVGSTARHRPGDRAASQSRKNTLPRKMVCSAAALCVL
jgi:hypothetical protein